MIRLTHSAVVEVWLYTDSENVIHSGIMHCIFSPIAIKTF